MSRFRDVIKWLSVGLFSVAFNAQSAPLKLDARALAESLAEQEPRPFSGVVMIAQGDEVLFRYAAGVKGRLSKESRFAIGSLSKQITAVLALQLAQSGAIKLDATLADYDSGLTEPWLDRVRIRELLNHTSGVTRPGEPLKFAPGSGFAYSNYGYDIVGALVEKVSQHTYSKLAATLFQQCGMTESVVPSAENTVYLERLATGYRESDQGELQAVDNQTLFHHAPSSGVVSTAQDLVRWSQCLYEGEALQPEWRQRMLAASATRSHRWGELGYGFGVQVSQQAPSEFSHSGYAPGYISTLAYYPERKITLVVLENVAWSLSDIRRVFHHHDRVRRLLLQAMDMASTSVAAQH
ncbi:Beta-lactamase class C and other penicillin binding protein [Hahella chejuensis KCTC 2396]|uniref:Beta-lactamase class C and other penicillin binding protein n=1 Tax=Hahella chejuensis (strain KCTC 2396) TaxID=349521 RepID=Q2SG54_HAHCH|nr:serine hydrolase domain-containing protein [Hahella chejuensis]ABC30370.1 Beta-lactamase class C and other penicillin binding protein [Hahella chejuensis KCTC 2396]